MISSDESENENDDASGSGMTEARREVLQQQFPLQFSTTHTQDDTVNEVSCVLNNNYIANLKSKLKFRNQRP